METNEVVAKIEASGDGDGDGVGGSGGGGSSAPCRWCNCSRQLKGTLISVLGVLVITPDTLLIREVSGGEVSDMTVQFYRFMPFGFTIAAFFFLTETKEECFAKLKGVGWVGIIAALVWGASNMLFTVAIQKTQVATVLVILATQPMCSAIMEWLCLGEKIPLRTIVCSLVCFGAILLIFAQQMTSSNQSSNDDTIGAICAVLAAITNAGYFVLLRVAKAVQKNEPDMLPTLSIGGIAVGLVSLCLGADPNSVKSTREGFLLAFQGFVSLPLAFGLLTIGPSMITASEVCLYFLLETILGPCWVYLGGHEAPPPLTVYGGIILIFAVLVNSLLALREDKIMSDGTSVQQEEEEQKATPLPTNEDEDEENHLPTAEAAEEGKRAEIELALVPTTQEANL